MPLHRCQAGVYAAEAIGLTWDCVDFEKRQLTINKQLQKRPLAESDFTFTPLKNGDDIKTVQGNLGHATAAFTLDIYGHVSERMKEDSANRMQQYI